MAGPRSLVDWVVDPGVGELGPAGLKDEDFWEAEDFDKRPTDICWPKGYFFGADELPGGEVTEDPGLAHGVKQLWNWPCDERHVLWRRQPL